MPCGSVASCEPHDGLCWFYYPGIWGNGPHPLRVVFEKDVGSQLGKVTRHCLHRSTRPGCWAALHLQPSSVQKAILRMVVSCPGNVYKLCHIVGWPVPSTLSLSVTFWPHSARAIWSPTSPRPPLSQRSLHPRPPTCVKSGLTLLQQSRPPGWCTLP